MEADIVWCPALTINLFGCRVSIVPLHESQGLLHGNDDGDWAFCWLPKAWGCIVPAGWGAWYPSVIPSGRFSVIHTVPIPISSGPSLAIRGPYPITPFASRLIWPLPHGFLYLHAPSRPRVGPLGHRSPCVLSWSGVPMGSSHSLAPHHPRKSPQKNN